MKVTKAAGVLASGTPDAAQLEKINGQAKSRLSAEDVYMFSVRLCDDQVDRDWERFSQEALKALAPMFIGKTGICDHAWSSEKQVARIFDCETEYENGVMFLKAWAYILRTAGTEELIRQIEGGIKKEVSVGCAMGRAICSVCGAEYGSCSHHKGETYGSEVCTAVLCDPMDAYEFSFVAVPAQRDSGVLKKLSGEGFADTAELERLKAEAELGRLYRAELEKNVVRMGLVLDLGLGETMLKSIAAGLDGQMLAEMDKALEKKMAEQFPPAGQLQTQQNTATDSNSAFLI